MDWSLALMSQGVESTIDHAEDDQSWSLVVDQKDLNKALRTLRHYKVENRHWASWQQPLPWPGMHFDWGSMVWAVLLIAFYVVSTGNPAIQRGGWLDIKAVSEGQYWRLFTAMQLHADLVHLAGNLSIGVLLLGLAMGRYGTGLGLLLAYLAGLGGNLLSFTLYSPPFYGLGASGMVMGALGLLTAQAISWRNIRYKGRTYLIAGLAAGLLLLALYGMSPGTDSVAHTGGFLTGLILGIIFSFIGASVGQNSRLNIASGVLVGVLVGLTWTLALLRAKSG